MIGQNIGRIQSHGAIICHGYIIIRKVEPQTKRIINILLENNEPHLMAVSVLFPPSLALELSKLKSAFFFEL